MLRFLGSPNPQICQNRRVNLRLTAKLLLRQLGKTLKSNPYWSNCWNSGRNKLQLGKWTPQPELWRNVRSEEDGGHSLHVQATLLAAVFLQSHDKLDLNHRLEFIICQRTAASHTQLAVRKTFLYYKRQQWLFLQCKLI